VGVHSATKYLNVTGYDRRVIVGSSEFIKAARHTAKNIGGSIKPFNAWLITRG